MKVTKLLSLFNLSLGLAVLSGCSGDSSSGSGRTRAGADMGAVVGSNVSNISRVESAAVSSVLSRSMGYRYGYPFHYGHPVYYGRRSFAGYDAVVRRR